MNEEMVPILATWMAIKRGVKQDKLGWSVAIGFSLLAILFVILMFWAVLTGRV